MIKKSSSLITFILLFISALTVSAGGIVNNNKKEVWVDDFHYIIHEGTFVMPSDEILNVCGESVFHEEYGDKYLNDEITGTAEVIPVNVGQRIQSYSFSGDIEVPEFIVYDEKKYAVQILNYAFYNCSKITHVKLPHSIYDINEAFYQCTSLESIELPPFIGLLAGSPFYRCISLKSVVLPKYLYRIQGNYTGCFEKCDSIETIICPPLVPPEMDNEFHFSNKCYKNATLYVPQSSIEDYKTAFGWKNFITIKSLEEFDGDLNDPNNNGGNNNVTDITNFQNQNLSLYDLYGNKIVLNNYQDLNHLSPGIYIINGKKYIIK